MWTALRTLGPLHFAPTDLSRSPRGPARRSPQLPSQDPMARRHDPHSDGAARVAGAARPYSEAVASSFLHREQTRFDITEYWPPVPAEGTVWCPARAAWRAANQRVKREIGELPWRSTDTGRVVRPRLTPRRSPGFQTRSECPPLGRKPTQVPRRAFRPVKRPNLPSLRSRDRSRDVYRGRNC